ncbi:MAG: cyclic nucleotide-binding domain-containing protein [Candidatus Hydrogenedentes bacterium]|nr:cyclic nucleotide-binding domain-containing protein [Candidatus Hydrogenedentota bacterium]
MYDLDNEIGGLPFLLELDDYDRARIVAVFREVSVRQHVALGTALFSTADTKTDDGYIVFDGVVVIESEDGTTRTVLPTCLLGEMKQFDFDGKHHRMANVRAETELEALRFSWSQLYATLDKTLKPEEVKLFRTALWRYAWMHYLDLQGEL